MRFNELNFFFLRLFFRVNGVSAQVQTLYFVNGTMMITVRAKFADPHRAGGPRPSVKTRFVSE